MKTITDGHLYCVSNEEIKDVVEKLNNKYVQFEISLRHPYEYEIEEPVVDIDNLVVELQTAEDEIRKRKIFVIKLAEDNQIDQSVKYIKKASSKGHQEITQRL